jgi:hypothetical protein
MLRTAMMMMLVAIPPRRPMVGEDVSFQRLDNILRVGVIRLLDTRGFHLFAGLVPRPASLITIGEVVR